MIEIFAEESFCKVLGFPDTLLQNLVVFVTKSCAKPRKGIKIIIFIFLIFSIGVLGFELS